MGSLVTIFNDSSKLALPYTNYNGSFFFSENQELSFRTNSPKGHVVSGIVESDGRTNERSFGAPFERSKLYNVYVDFFTPHNVQDSQGNKNAELINHYMDLIDQTVVNNPIPGFLLINAVDDIAAGRADEVANNIWAGRKLLVYRQRK